MSEDAPDRPAKGGSWRRRLLKAALVAIGLLAVLAVALAVSAALALRSSTVRAALLERAAAAIEEASGVRLTAEDFALGGLLTTLEVRGVELAAAGAGRPFLTVPRARAELRPLSFLTRRWEIRSLEVDSPVLDLGAPRPEGTGEEAEEPRRELVISRLELAGGTISGPAETLDPDSWLESWSIEGIELGGTYRPEETVLELARGTLLARRRGAGTPAAETLEIALTGRLRGPGAGPYAIETFDARGAGLELTASGRMGAGSGSPLEIAFDLEADPTRLVPGLTQGGRIAGRGDLDLRRGSGRAHFEARDFPAELVEPWIGRGAMARMGAAGSHLDLVADLDLDPAVAGEAGGHAELSWRRGDVSLLTATADGRGLRVRDGELDLGALAGELRLAGVGLQAEMLEPWLGREALVHARAAGTRLDLDATAVLEPGSPETARGRGRLVWRRGKTVLMRTDATTTGGGLRADGSLDLGSLSARLELAASDLPAELATAWVSAAELERFAVAGTHLDLGADLTVRNPRTPTVAGRARAVWRSGEEILLETSATTLGGGHAGPPGARLAVAGELLPASPGRRRLTAEIAVADWQRIADARIADGRLELEVPDLEAAVGELRRRWPGLVPEAVAQWPLAGVLSAAVDLAGSLASPELDGEAVWRRGDGSAVTLAAAGEPLIRRGEAELTVEDLELAGLRGLAGPEPPELAGRVSGSVAVSGSPAAWTGTLRLDGEDLAWGPELPAVDRLELEAESDGAWLRLTRLFARAGERIFTGGGELALARPIERAGLRLEIEQPAAGVDRLLLDARLAGGVLELDLTEIELAGVGGGEPPGVQPAAGHGELSAAIPLAALGSLPQVGEALAAWPVALAEGPVTVRFSLPELDAAALLRSLEVEGAPESLVLAASGALELDLADPTASRGSLEVSKLDAADGEHRLEVLEPLRLELDRRRLAGDGVRLRLDGREIEATGGLDLRPGWRPPDPLADLVVGVDAVARGAVEASLLNPWLEGAAASGPLHLELTLRGPPDRLGGRLTVAGPEARLVALSPYFTRLESPEIEIELDAGEVFLSVARARLNQGTVELTGYREPGGEVELFAELEGVRYRLDYGLSTVLSGSLQLSLPAAAEGERNGELSGRLIVDRGLLRRDLNLEREVLGSLLAPVETLVPDLDDPLARIDLNLWVATADGVRIKNNLADLRATWSPLKVRGTLAAPRVDGRLDADPGGFVYLYGQTARVDEAAVTLSGYPEVPPRIDLEVTTSLEDPTVAREGAGRGPVAAPRRDTAAAETDRQALAAAGLASYYADRLAGRFGQALGGTRIEVAPLLVFGETDPGARLTVSRDLSTHVAVALSTDLTGVGRQIYLLDLHDFRRLPRLSGQLFTTDERNEGVTLQQTFELGGGKRDETGPRIREIRIAAPEGLERRRLAAATGFRRGERLPEGADFDVEVDVAEHLRRRGYPGAEVAVSTEAAGDGRVDLVVAVEPGPAVAFEFRGDELPRSARRSIRGLYRADFYQPAALDEMRHETVRALRGLGHLVPRVEITVVPAAPAAAAGSGGLDRTVVVEARGGVAQPIAAVEFRGVEADAAERLAAAYAAQADRVELLATDPEAERRLLALARGLGYPQPQVADRRIVDGRRLVVDLEPGPRRRIAEIRFEGVSADEVEKLRPLVTLEPGDPARADRIVGGTSAIENDLWRRGYADVRVRTLAVPRPAEAGHAADEVVLTYRVETGTRYEVAEVRFDGARATGLRWAERVAELEKGAPVDPEKIGEARRRLFATGIFRSVVPDVEREADLGRATVVFDVAERPRYQIAYGLRWETSEGAGAVVEAVDRNAFGRGVTLGLRTYYSADENNLRLYSAWPKIFGTRATLELFAEGGKLRDLDREEDRPGVDCFTRRTEGTVQVAYPLGRRTTTRAYYRYRRSRPVLETPNPCGPPDGPETNPVLGWQLLRDTRDDKIDPGRGFLGSIDLSGADPRLGGDSELLRFLGKVSLFRSAGGSAGRRLTWAQSWRLGLAAFDDQPLDPDDRFEAGGEYSVRGYPNDSIRGGEALLVVNQELRFPLWRDLRGLFFFDAGNVWPELADVDADLLKSLGFGLRASTPVGLVRFDVAFPLDRRPDDDSYRLYLGLGNIF